MLNAATLRQARKNAAAFDIGKVVAQGGMG